MNGIISAKTNAISTLCYLIYSKETKNGSAKTAQYLCYWKLIQVDNAQELLFF